MGERKETMEWKTEKLYLYVLTSCTTYFTFHYPLIFLVLNFLCVYKKSCKARLSKKIRRGLHRKSDETKRKEMKLALEKKRNHDYVHHSYKTTKQFQVPINSKCTTVETAILHIEEKRRWTYFVNFYLLCFMKKRDM